VDRDGGIRLKIKVEPRSSKPGLVGLYGDAVKIRLSSPPVEGKANEELVRFLADTLDVSRSDVTILSGHGAKNKIVAIARLDAARLDAWIRSGS
jgi:uncharacterized protein (TIGR00251 family)